MRLRAGSQVRILGHPSYLNLTRLAVAYKSDDDFERYLVKWEGHAGRTWESRNGIDDTEAMDLWGQDRPEVSVKPGPFIQGPYMLCSGRIDARQCCSDCTDYKAWNERIFIDAEPVGNVSDDIIQEC